MSVPQKIVLKSTTKISLNDRFTKLQTIKAPPQVTVPHVRANIAAGQQQMQRNARLTQQMANRPALQAAAFKLKKKSLQQRLGSNVKSRLTLGPMQQLHQQQQQLQQQQIMPQRGGRGITRGRGGSRGGVIRNYPYGDGPASALTWGVPRGRGQMRGRGRGISRGGSLRGTRGSRGNSRGGRGSFSANTRGFVRGGRFNDGGDWRGRWGRSFRGGRGGFRGRDMGGRGSGQQEQNGRGGGGARFNRGVGRGGRGPGRSGRGVANGRGRGVSRGGKPMTREQLDTQLDEYMSKTKNFLDAELDAYMASAEVE